MGQALYRKYRSKKLSEIVGQEHITDTLSKALEQGRISHAYLFTGPRGVGKTSIARILAHEINGLPYTDDSEHLDIIEIDAASNRRIDEIRDLRERVHVAPASAKYKVYIIDEVHMLTREAFNALLKTLEEPPAHVVFILATTDAHKLPETIVSRTQRYSFRPVEKDKVIGHLQDIAKQENIKVSDEALALLAEHGEGSFRDSISLLDQASSHGQALEVDDVRQLLGIPSDKSIQELLRAAASNDSAALMQYLNEMYGQGYQAAAIAKQLGQALRSRLIDGNLEFENALALQLMEKLIQVPAAHEPARYLEICLLSVIKPSDTSIPRLAASVKSTPEKTVQPEPKISEVEDMPEPVQEAVEAVETVEIAEAEESIQPSAVKEFSEAVWPEVLAELKKQRNTLYGVIRMATPVFTDDGNLKLVFSFAFHQKRSSEAGNRQLLTDIIKNVTGKSVNIEVLLDAAAKSSKPAAKGKQTDSSDLSAISNIFGDAKLLES